MAYESLAARAARCLNGGMAIAALMVDVDGVLIVDPEPRGWSAELERDLGIAPALLQSAFFEPHWEDVVLGRASLRARLAPVLQAIAPQVGCDALIDYWFGHDAQLDHALLAELAVVRAQGISVHLATVQEHERAHYLWRDLDLRSRFDGLHYAAELGCAKPDSLFYARIEARTGLAPGALFLIDDRPANVAAARARGWGAALWTGGDTLAGVLTNARN